MLAVSLILSGITLVMQESQVTGLQENLGELSQEFRKRDELLNYTISLVDQLIEKIDDNRRVCTLLAEAQQALSDVVYSVMFFYPSEWQYRLTNTLNKLTELESEGRDIYGLGVFTTHLRNAIEAALAYDPVTFREQIFLTVQSFDKIRIYYAC